MPLISSKHGLAMQTFFLTRLFAGLTVIVSLFCGQLVSRASDGRYVVTLKPVAVVSDSIVRLGDIAEIDGESDAVVEALQTLDLQDAPKPNEKVSITKAQVDIRLKLAKAPAGRIVVMGDRTIVGLSRKNSATNKDSAAQRTRNAGSNSKGPIRHVSALRAAADEATERTPSKKVVHPTAATKAEVVAVAKQVVLSRLPWDPSDIEIEAMFVGQRANDLTEEQTLNLQAELKSAWPPLGRVQVVVHAPQMGEAEPGIPVVLSVKYFQNTVIAKRAIEMGRTIQPSDVYIDRREVRELGVQLQEVNDVVGRVALRPIPALQPVRIGDVKAVQNQSSQTAATVAKSVDRTPVIRRGDTVQMVAMGGPLAISIMAKAQQDGQVGNVIRMENVDSKKVVMGKVRLIAKPWG